ncbi:MAG: bifunctional DNA-formamidopyrimidine glycosylase/DNA-(apurinic or apyrimidinic site) lyase [Propionibacteriaceae bacterium]|jgi:formamidopyrimidine-DNA glycosylase|nr:bifunctional DNA-formamidopyrimidine glycosylase/DNA-(apurinic or apyrimidinic site) lyase [Propionibacteriaceae bacterium]
MPELPEVETVRRGLQRLIVGQRVESVQVLAPGSFGVEPGCDVNRDLLGALITDVRRRGKVLMVGLGAEVEDDMGPSGDMGSHDAGSSYDAGSSGGAGSSVGAGSALDCSGAAESGAAGTRGVRQAGAVSACLVIHLKMTGQLVYQGDQHWGAGHPNDSLVHDLPDRSTRVIVGFEDGSRLYFNDQRKFGWVRLMTTAQADALKLITTMGPEPLTGQPWPEFLRRMRRHHATPIKAALLNQTVLAGVGNIYADEALWTARIHPATQVDALSDAALRRLLDAVREVMTTSLEFGGSTDRTYVDAEGRAGSYLSFAHVFRREGQPCPRCGTTIIKTRVAGRGTHLCPHCQRIKRRVTPREP